MTATNNKRFKGNWQRMWFVVSIASLVAVFVLWWLLTSGLSLIPPLYFPPPSAVLQSLETLGGSIIADAGATLWRVLISWAIGSLLGIVVGLVMSRSKLIYYVLNPLIEGLRPVPPIALIPFVILWFGIGDSGKIFLAALGCFMVLVVNTVVSSANVAPVYSRAAKSLGASDSQVYRTVILPAIIPELLSGLRIGSALAFAIVVAAEFIGAEAGIGALIMQASRTLDTPVVLLGTLIIGLEAFLLDRVIQFFSRRITSWNEAQN